MRPTLARVSSAASGLRFCGMIEEPVVNLSLKLDEAELRRRPQHDLLGEARQVHGADRGGGERLQDEVAVGDAVERVVGRLVEAERLRCRLPVDGERRAGERRRAERALVEPRARVGEPAAVAAEHLDVGEQVMAEGDGLRRLQMREARHDGRRMCLGLADERQLQCRQRRVERIEAFAHVEPEVGRHLIVARARRMQPPGGRADQLLQAALDVHVHVFERAREPHLAAVDLGQDGDRGP